MTPHEPQFFEELRTRVNAGDAWVPSLPKKIPKKIIPSFFKVSFTRSVVFHLVFIVGMPIFQWLDSMLGWQSEREARIKARLDMARTAIRVDVVDLPSIKLSELSQVDLTKDVGENTPQDAAQEEKIIPSPTAMTDKTKAAQEAAARENERSIEEEIKKAENQRIKDIQDRLRASQRRNELIAKLQKKKEASDNSGRAVLSGNILSQGYSTTGDVATDADVYNGKAAAHLRKHFNVPAWVQASNLSARVLVKIAPDGRVVRQDFLKRSGNTEFDSYVERAIRSADPFPPPPETLKRTFMEEGVEWGFPK